MDDCPCCCFSACTNEVKTEVIVYPHHFNRSLSNKKNISTKTTKLNNSIETITRISTIPSTHVQTKQLKSKEGEDLAPITQDSDKENSDMNMLTSKRNGLISYTSNRSIKTNKNHFQKVQKIQKDITVILLERENVHLRDELHKLKRQEEDLLIKQKNMKDKQHKQINHLTNVSEDLRRRSLQRKKEMEELQSLLSWRKSYKKGCNIPKSRKQKNREKLERSTKPIYYWGGERDY